MGLPGHQRPARLLLPGVELRRQEAAGVHLSGRLPVQRGGGPVGQPPARQVQHQVPPPEAAQQHGPQHGSAGGDHRGASYHLPTRQLRGQLFLKLLFLS